MSALLQRLYASPLSILLALSITLLWGAASMPLYDLDEGAFTEATREMIASGNYTSPQLNGQPRTDKPILIYWLQAASVHLFGLNELALRLPSILAALGWLLATYRFTRQQTDRPTAVIASLLLILSAYVGIISKAAIADALLNLFLALTLFDIYRHSQDPTPNPHRLWRIYLWIGLGFLTKGPVALYFPVLISLLYYASYRRLKEWSRLIINPIGWLILLSVILPWHIAVYLDSGWTFYQGFYLHHNLDRFAAPMEGHNGGPFYYLIAAPLILMPFGGWLLAQSGRIAQIKTQPLDRYLWLWFVSVLLTFSLSGTKLPHYLLYGISGILILMARDRHQLKGHLKTALSLIPALALIALLAALPWIFQQLAQSSQRSYEHALFQNAVQALQGPASIALIALAISAVILSALPKQTTSQRLLNLGLIQGLMIATILAPAILSALQDGPKAAALYARQHQKTLKIHRSYQPSISVYRQQIVNHDNPQPGDWVYVRNDHLNDYLKQAVPGHPEASKRLIFQQPPAALVAIEPAPRSGPRHAQP